MTKRERRTFTPEFKKKLVQLYQNGKTKRAIINEYGLTTSALDRSLSMKGCPYDNAVAEATFKIIKTEFVHQMKFNSLEHLTLEFSDYVNWFNKLRIHGTLGCVSPIEYRRSSLKKVV